VVEVGRVLVGCGRQHIATRDGGRDQQDDGRKTCKGKLTYRKCVTIGHVSVVLTLS
jgi:hypothetical protein